LQQQKAGAVVAIATAIENLTVAPQEMLPLADIKIIPVLDFSWHTACIKPIQ
jgi:hypothetical protein